MCQFKGAFVHSLHACDMYCIDVASQICRIMKRRSPELTIGPIASFVVGSAVVPDDTHKVFFFLCVNMHIVSENQWDFKITTSGDSFPIFPQSQSLVARHWKFPTWLIFTRRQSRNPERWYARSLSITITYLFRIIPQILFGISLLARGKERERSEKRRAWFVWIQAKDISIARKQINKTKTKLNWCYIIPRYMLVGLSCEQQLNTIGRYSDWKEAI